MLNRFFVRFKKFSRRSIQFIFRHVKRIFISLVIAITSSVISYTITFSVLNSVLLE